MNEHITSVYYQNLYSLFLPSLFLQICITRSLCCNISNTECWITSTICAAALYLRETRPFPVQFWNDWNSYMMPYTFLDYLDGASMQIAANLRGKKHLFSRQIKTGCHREQKAGYFVCQYLKLHCYKSLLVYIVFAPLKIDFFL